MSELRWVPRLSRLRWKLAASATVATVAAILVVLVISEVSLALSRPDPPSLDDLALAVVRSLPGTVLFLLPIGVIVGTIFGLITSRGLVRRIGRLGDAAQAWSHGELGVRVDDPSRDELGDLSRNFERMAGELDRLMDTRQELAAVDERNRLARELHDTVKQQVFSVSLFLGTAAAQVESDPSSAAVHLEEARAQVRQASRDLNRLILALRPAALEGKGLATALVELAEGWSERTDIRTDVRIRGERELPLEMEQGFYRIAQEALANVARHSGASDVRLRLEIDAPVGEGAQAPRVLLEVSDDGDGFDTRAARSGFGLRSMEERMAIYGGSLEVESSSAGTRILASCQVER